MEEKNVEELVSKIMEEIEIMQDTNFTKLSIEDLRALEGDLREKLEKVSDILENLYENSLENAGIITVTEGVKDNIKDLLDEMPPIPTEKNAEIDGEELKIEEEIEELPEEDDTIDIMEEEISEDKEILEEINSIEELVESEEQIIEDAPEENIAAAEEEINVDVEEIQEEPESANAEPKESGNSEFEEEIDTNKNIDIFVAPDEETVQEAKNAISQRETTTNLYDVVYKCEITKKNLMEKIATKIESQNEIEKEEQKELEERTR